MKFKCTTPLELLKKIKDLNIKMVDLRFTDMPGTTHHITIPIKFLVEDLFTNGVGFDGSSVRGFRSVNRFGKWPQSVLPCKNKGVISVSKLARHARRCPISRTHYF